MSGTLPNLTVVTGNGKGKTTGGIGRAVLAAWAGETVLMLQFLKGTGYTGELRSQTLWRGALSIRQFGAGCPFSAEIADGSGACRRCGECFRNNRRPENRFVDQAWACAQAAAASAEWDLLVLDEISHPLNRGLLDKRQFLDWIQAARTKVRFILTGRNMPPELVALADEATECEAVKHPISRGIYGRRGIEY